METDLTYNSAFAALQNLVRQIEHEDIQLDTLADKVHEANELIRFCENKLRTIQDDVDKAM